ncbi:30S ribosomal protein S17e [Candidatus Pacearchaeota archaeon]|nr:30S ribosomal protein S17e [Candidatus Pacearchaeota archaeon]
MVCERKPWFPSMGKIKSKLVRRASNTFLKKGVEFTESFNKNKKILKNTMPSKKLRNQIAGFLARIKKQEKQNP